MLLDRFLKYVKIDTQSDEDSNTTPSSKNQFDLLHVLEDELKALGVECELTDTGRLYGFIPGNTKYEAVGVCAHVDTAPDFNGSGVKPNVIKKYDGSDLKLGKTDRVLSIKEYPKLKRAVGKTLITTDGTSLLGADDKAGVAIIMEIVEAILKLNIYERRPMYILFTPDEEIGRGAEIFDTNKFKAVFAYTFDGSEPEVINIETFNAKSAQINITGKSIHPGDAKGVMINAVMVASEFISMLPAKLVPSKTEGHQGFNHLTEISGSVDNAHMHFILRNHDQAKLKKQEKQFFDIVEKLYKKHPGVKIDLKISDSYKNMLGVIVDKPACKNHIEQVFKDLAIEFKYEPIRGGTDGTTFSYLGCPTPNLGTGSYNHHGPFEYAILEEMEQLVKIGVQIYKVSE
ncbi:MAG: peptidase T [Firmicutes bacterium]|nr:peptidase T [Candidatus Fiminaster equi]